MDAKQFYDHLTKDIIPFWNRMRDDENGGFYGYADAKGIPDKQSDKGVILNCRILWFYSAAYRFLNQKPLLDMAEHAYAFFLEHCYDKENGGVYWLLHADGSPADDTKYAYNMAFAIYALSAYYEVSGKEEALKLAMSLFHLIETVCKDEDGYLEAFDRTFSVPAVNEELSENGVIAQRTMNTLLHALESYTELYRVSRSEEVRAALEQILEAFRTKVYNPDKKRCEVFFDMEYHSLIDLQSYGHDIETSWLIDRALSVLNDPEIRGSMQPVVDGLAESAYEKGLDKDLFALNYECDRGRLNQTKSWWPQAESVIGFYNAYRNNPNKDYFLEASEKVWEFIQCYVIDKQTGEWIENIGPGTSAAPDQPLVHLWKCPYHTGRMCMEMAKRLEQ